MRDSLDAEGHDVRPGKWWVKQLLHALEPQGDRQVSERAPQPRAAARQDATHTHTVSADRVVNIDETSCRLLLVHQNGWCRRGVKQSQLQANTREATTFTVAFSVDCGPLDMVEQPWQHARHITSENNWATTTTLQLTAALAT